MIKLARISDLLLDHSLYSEDEVYINTKEKVTLYHEDHPIHDLILLGGGVIDDSVEFDTIIWYKKSPSKILYQYISEHVCLAETLGISGTRVPEAEADIAEYSEPHEIYRYLSAIKERSPVLEDALKKKSPLYYVQFYSEQYDRDSYIETFIATDFDEAFSRAFSIYVRNTKGDTLGDVLLERAKSSPHTALTYARGLNGKNVPKVIEEILSKSAYCGFLYASEITKTRFKAYEANMFRSKSNSVYWTRYKTEIIKLPNGTTNINKTNNLYYRKNERW